SREILPNSSQDTTPRDEKRGLRPRNLIRLTLFRRPSLAGGTVGRSHCRRRSSLAEKHSVDTIKKLLEAAKPRKFSESIEVAVNLRDVDLSVPKNRVEEDVVLPKGRGKPIRVCVFASGELALKARNVADLVIQPQEIEEYASDKRK